MKYEKIMSIIKRKIFALPALLFECFLLFMPADSRGGGKDKKICIAFNTSFRA